MLPSAEMDDLPVVVKFILQSIGDSDAFEVRVNIALNFAGYCSKSTETTSKISKCILLILLKPISTFSMVKKFHLNDHCDLIGQNCGLSWLKKFWPVIKTGDLLFVIFSPDHTAQFHSN